MCPGGGLVVICELPPAQPMPRVALWGLCVWVGGSVGCLWGLCGWLCRGSLGDSLGGSVGLLELCGGL